MNFHFDRKKFFDGVKSRIDASLEQSQVDGLNFLLDQFEECSWKDIRWTAYAFATAAHETAYSFQPVEEGYYLEAKHGKAFLAKFQKGLRYFPYFGRGFVQLTWENSRIKNYSKATKQLREQTPGIVALFEYQSSKTFDLVKNPEQAMNPLIAFAVMILGMEQGWFTGKKLTDFIHGKTCNYFEARTIINGHDKAGAIAKLAERFENILRASQTNSTADASDTGKTLPANLPAERPTEKALPSNQNEMPEAKIEVGAEGIKVESPIAQPQNVVIEKEPAVVEEKPKGVLGTLWAKITAALTGIGGTDVAIEKAQQAQALGISADTWRSIAYVIIAGIIIWILYHTFVMKVWPWAKWLLGRIRTHHLVTANTTSTNQVSVEGNLTADRIKELEVAGWIVVRRG